MGNASVSDLIGIRMTFPPIAGVYDREYAHANADSMSHLAPTNRLGSAAMEFSRLDRGELIAIVGGAVLALSIFLTWYTLGNTNASLSSCHGPNSSCSGLDSLGGVRDPLLLASIAPPHLRQRLLRRQA